MIASPTFPGNNHARKEVRFPHREVSLMNLRRDTRATRPRPIAAYPAKRVGFPRVAQRRRKVATFRRRIDRQQSRKVSGAPAARSRDNKPSARSHGREGPNGDAARKIGRAPWRERVCQIMSITVVDVSLKHHHYIYKTPHIVPPTL